LVDRSRDKQAMIPSTLQLALPRRNKINPDPTYILRIDDGASIGSQASRDSHPMIAPFAAAHFRVQEQMEWFSGTSR